MPLKWLRRQKIQQNLFQNEFLEVLSFKIINFEFSKSTLFLNSWPSNAPTHKQFITGFFFSVDIYGWLLSSFDPEIKNNNSIWNRYDIFAYHPGLSSDTTVNFEVN